MTLEDRTKVTRPMNVEEYLENENIRQEIVFARTASGQIDEYKGFAEQCTAEYDLDGWTVPDLINPDDTSIFSDKIKNGKSE